MGNHKTARSRVERDRIVPGIRVAGASTTRPALAESAPCLLDDIE
jgi:hypothetical protein